MFKSVYGAAQQDQHQIYKTDFWQCPHTLPQLATPNRILMCLQRGMADTTKCRPKDQHHGY